MKVTIELTEAEVKGLKVSRLHVGRTKNGKPT